MGEDNGEDSEGEEEFEYDPNERMRPQVPSYLYYQVRLWADEHMVVESHDVAWWKCLKALMDAEVDGFDIEGYRELMKEDPDVTDIPD